MAAAYYVLFCDAIVSGRSHILKTVAGSSLENEYMALYYYTVEVVYLRNVLEEMGPKQMEPMKIYKATSSLHREDRLQQAPRDPREDSAGCHRVGDCAWNGQLVQQRN